MKWTDITLVKDTYEKDELNNNVPCGVEEIVSCKGRYTPWSMKQIEAEGRELTKREQQYMIPSSLCQLADARHATAALIGGIRRTIKGVDTVGERWIRIRVEVYRT